MLISDTLRCALLTVTIVACCLKAESKNQHQNHGLTADKTIKQITKRDSSVVFEHYPVEAYLKHGPKFIYKRISNPRYRSPRPASGIRRTKSRTVSPSRKVMRKYRKSVNLKYDPPRHHKRPPKISYANPKSQNQKPLYNVLKRSPSFLHRPASIPVGFGEPLEDYLLDYNIPKILTYGKYKIPRDQIGNIIAASNDGRFSIHKISNPIDLDNEDYQDQKIKTWKTVYLNDFDDNFPESKTWPPLTIQKSEYEKQTAPDDDRSSFAEIYKYEKRMKMDAFNKKKNKKRADRPKELNKPYSQLISSKKGPKKQIVVGGQYAEPPARYVSHYHNPSLLCGDDDMSLPKAVDPDIASSATISSYVNYKNSNLAFSPQNLNDAFSILD